MSDNLVKVAKALAWEWMAECEEHLHWIEDAKAIADLKTVDEIAYALCHRNGNCINRKTGEDECPQRSNCIYAGDFMKMAQAAFDARSILSKDGEAAT